MRRLVVGLLVTAAVLLPGAGPVWAHNVLAEAVPAQDAVLASAPGEVRLRFLETLNPQFTTIAVSDAAKKRVATSEPVVDGATGSVTFTSPVGDGVYTVAYRVVSKDGHVVQGSYRFTVGEAASAAPSPDAAPAVSSPDAQETEDAGSPIGLIAALAGAAVIIAGAAVIIVRRRAAGAG
ncbi:copper resistance CopC family protein [Actinoplanes sp. NPDC051851]|uniref:copper resistance CopC family protein n=1 Tax=Actinoplanes sp. NPDC051851 TaxID=3154753 RepID=UPI003414F768